MGSPDLFKALSETFKNGEAAPYAIEDVRLTPYLSIVVAILYMMAVDGDISDRESSQLQSVIGADGPILRRAVAYAQSHEVESFLLEAPPLLDDHSRLCLLINVADSLMADGELQKVELALFDRMLVAFGHNRTSFQPHFDAIAAKGRTSVLGDFDAAAASEEMTPPKALVVAMLYMMSADGSMASEEIGRLSAAIGGSQAMLKASLRYVSQVRLPQFLSLAAGLLDKRQRMCVLLNTCDAMMSDRQVVAAERELFGRMMLAFGIEAASLDGYLHTMQVKNDVPIDADRLAPAGQASSSMGLRQGTKKKEEGVVFERKRTWTEETGEAGEQTAAKRLQADGQAVGDKRRTEIDSRISRTMQENLDRMSEGMNDGVTMDSMERQSRAEGGVNPAIRGGKGAQDLRTTTDAEGAKDRRSANDQKHTGGRRTATDGKGDAQLRSTTDGEGPKSLRAAADGGGDTDTRSVTDAQGDSDIRSARDRLGPNSRRTAQDAAGASDLRATLDGKGTADLRVGIDGQGDADQRKANDAGGPSDLRSTDDGEGDNDLRALSDREGLDELRSAEDANGSRAVPVWRDASASDNARHWQDAAAPPRSQALNDAAAMRPGKHLIDDRRAFDRVSDDDDDVDLDEPLIEGRMGAVRDRTQCIRDHVNALHRSRTLRAGSRLPSLPPGPRSPTIASIDAVAIAIEPAAVRASDDQRQAENSHQMLLYSDEGGPQMSEPTEAVTPEQAKVNRLLRLRSAVLLPALFVTYGATMVGETMSERLFITNENIATDARIVHQMASVQQTVYRIAPETVQLAPDAMTAGASAAAVAAVTAEPSDREKADSFLEQRKKELMEKFQQHQSTSVVAAERQQWFIYAKSIVLLGLGMAFWGVLFRSLRMLHASTAAGLIGLLLSANGYWLFVRI